METVGKIWAQGRNYASMFVGFIGGVGIISASQSKGLTDSLTEIANGVSQIAHGATSIWQILIAAFPFIAVWFASIAGKSASTTNQAAAVQAAVNDPATPISIETKAAILDTAVAAGEIKSPIVVSDPALAEATQSKKVIAK